MGPPRQKNQDGINIMPRAKKVKESRGGKRPGAGRPKKAGERVVIQAWVTPGAKVKLRAMMRPGEDGFGDFLERLAQENTLKSQDDERRY